MKSLSKGHGRTTRVRCASGVLGWQCKLRANYSGFAEFAAWACMYGLHTRLGFASPRAAWDANPVIQGSVNPSDFRRAP